ncbi:hypothetical protein KM043_013776 [Ampulex compressa]|nr:hypothetical protein KM043_013776 [Ampulex compressa]
MRSIRLVYKIKNTPITLSAMHHIKFHQMDRRGKETLRSTCQKNVDARMSYNVTDLQRGSRLGQRNLAPMKKSPKTMLTAASSFFDGVPIGHGLLHRPERFLWHYR